MIDDLNPYAPPATVISGHPRSCTINGAEVSAVCIRRTWFGRELKLEGGLEAVIRYTAAGSGERVFVNDDLVARSSIWHMSVVAPRIEFEINLCGASIPATICAYAACLQLFRVTRFSLAVNGHLLYLEPDGG